jgi:esterase
LSYLNNFYHRRTGAEGSPRIVFLHGLMGFSSNWQRIAKALEDEYEILVYDQRGHGRSFHPESGYAPKDFAGDLKLILDELGWDKIHLVGHSMGGRAAISFAAQWPEHLEKLVIEDIGAEPTWSSMTSLRKLILGVPVPFPTRDAAHKYFSHGFHERFGGEHNTRDLGPYFLANLKSMPDGSLDWRVSMKGILESLEQGRSLSMWPEWEAIKTPTLLIRGTRSEMLTPEIYAEMLRRQTCAKGVEINAGHWIHSERPEEFIEAVRDFLKEGTQARIG